jgi:hypothetical protein
MRLTLLPGPQPLNGGISETLNATTRTLKRDSPGQPNPEHEGRQRRQPQADDHVGRRLAGDANEACRAGRA